VKNVIRVSIGFGILFFGFVIWYSVAADYSDNVTSGTYHLAQNGETSTLVLMPDHSFQQELSREGNTKYAKGTWRRVGEGGIDFSNEFLVVSGQEPGPDGTDFGDIQKDFGFLVSIKLRQYHVLWYGRTDSSSDNTPSGTYKRDEAGVDAILILKPDHTFEQTVSHLGVAKHSQGIWNFRQNGDITFSREFLKTSGESLTENETASAWNPKGSNLQIEIAMTSKSGVPTFRKKQFPW
jgi:hypothetical protein